MLIDEIKNIKSTKKNLKEFGFLVGAVFGIIGSLFWWKGNYLYPYFIFVSIFLVFFGLVLPITLKPIHKIWMAIALVIGFVMTRIILFVLFYMILTPTSLLSKFSGKNFLDLEVDKSKTSYWQYRSEKEFYKERYEKQY